MIEEINLLLPLLTELQQGTTLAVILFFVYKIAETVAFATFMILSVLKLLAIFGREISETEEH